MPLFNNSAIAASFKTSSIQSTPDIANTGSEKKNWNGVETRKTELVKEVMPIGTTAGFPDDLQQLLRRPK
jgi:hypothetical protein